jgi:formylmethanofuran dehydrogenase subunit E
VKTLDEYLQEAERAHGHMCAGQVLGVRMAMLGLKRLEIDDPGQDRKRLLTYVEIDRCATDAVAVVTGCRLGKRALKFRDWGKTAATFLDLATQRAIRVAAKDSAKAVARSMYPELASRNAQMRAYQEMADEDLFDEVWVEVTVRPEDMPGYKSEHAVCAGCGDGIQFKREVERDGRILCRACAGERYYRKISHGGTETQRKVQDENIK